MKWTFDGTEAVVQVGFRREREWGEAVLHGVLGSIGGFTVRVDSFWYLLLSADYSFSPLPLFFD